MGQGPGGARHPAVPCFTLHDAASWLDLTLDVALDLTLELGLGVGFGAPNSLVPCFTCMKGRVGTSPCQHRWS